MSCSVCAGYSSYNCPCCSEEVKMVECPDCQGSGYTPYKALDIRTRKEIPVTELAYAILPENEDIAQYKGMRYCKMDIDICPTCRGEGEIPEYY